MSSCIISIIEARRAYEGSLAAAAVDKNTKMNRAELTLRSTFYNIVGVRKAFNLWIE
jgi:hypothetical protein